MSRDEFNERLRKANEYLTSPVTVNRLTLVGVYGIGVGVGMVLTGRSVRRQMKGSDNFLLTKKMMDVMRENEIPVTYITHQGEQIAVALVKPGT